MKDIHKFIHEPVRLSIMTYLMDEASHSFNELLEELDVTRGNLSVQTSKLESEGLVAIKKEFKGKKPHTTFKITKKGVTTFEEYLSALEEVIDKAKKKREKD